MYINVYRKKKTITLVKPAELWLSLLALGSSDLASCCLAGLQLCSWEKGAMSFQGIDHHHHHCQPAVPQTKLLGLSPCDRAQGKPTAAPMGMSPSLRSAQNRDCSRAFVHHQSQIALAVAPPTFFIQLSVARKWDFGWPEPEMLELFQGCQSPRGP